MIGPVVSGSRLKPLNLSPSDWEHFAFGVEKLTPREWRVLRQFPWLWGITPWLDGNPGYRSIYYT